MSRTVTLLEDLDGPAGWIAVALVGGVLVWIAYDYLSNEAENEFQNFTCWFNNTCLLKEMFTGKG